jgi:tRNA dimethylallyltransferase
MLIEAGRGAEIVNADSMLVYRGMDIGTAKPSPEERAEIPHHLIDIFDIDQNASVAEFQKLARDAIAEIRGRGSVPLVVGGSSLYIRAIFDDLEFPGTDPAIRAKWEAELERVGAHALHEQLRARSPQAAAGILPGNGRRIVRALEVVELTGTFRSTLPEQRFAIEPALLFGLQIDREVLDQRIAARVAQMWRHGLPEETARLEALGLREAKTAVKALGYGQTLDFLSGSFSEQRTIENITFATRRFARKQLGWFKRDSRITWLKYDDPGNSQLIAERIQGIP